jgi:hypothetical protein
MYCHIINILIRKGAGTNRSQGKYDQRYLEFLPGDGDKIQSPKHCFNKYVKGG